jgi:hypothetical protein
MREISSIIKNKERE